MLPIGSAGRRITSNTSSGIPTTVPTKLWSNDLGSGFPGAIRYDNYDDQLYAIIRTDDGDGHISYIFDDTGTIEDDYQMPTIIAGDIGISNSVEQGNWAYFTGGDGDRAEVELGNGEIIRYTWSYNGTGHWVQGVTFHNNLNEWVYGDTEGKIRWANRNGTMIKTVDLDTYENIDHLRPVGNDEVLFTTSSGPVGRYSKANGMTWQVTVTDFQNRYGLESGPTYMQYNPVNEEIYFTGQSTTYNWGVSGYPFLVAIDSIDGTTKWTIEAPSSINVDRGYGLSVYHSGKNEVVQFSYDDNYMYGIDVIDREFKWIDSWDTSEADFTVAGNYTNYSNVNETDDILYAWDSTTPYTISAFRPNAW